MQYNKEPIKRNKKVKQLLLINQDYWEILKALQKILKCPIVLIKSDDFSSSLFI
jgi:hypothetical protein